MFHSIVRVVRVLIFCTMIPEWSFLVRPWTGGYCYLLFSQGHPYSTDTRTLAGRQHWPSLVRNTLQLLSFHRFN